MWRGLGAVVGVLLAGLGACRSGDAGGGGAGTVVPAAAASGAGGGCSWVAAPCTKQLLAALDKGNACFGHVSTCPLDNKQCGSAFDATTNSCSWADGAKVSFPAGASDPTQFTVTDPAGKECYRTMGNIFATGSQQLVYPEGTFTQSVDGTGMLRLTCPDGSSATGEVGTLQTCLGAPSLTQSTICCGGCGMSP